MTVTCENDAPTVASGGTLAYTENDPATALDPTLTVADIDSPIAGATVAMTTNHEGDEDVLALLGSHPGIVATVNLAGDILTLSHARQRRSPSAICHQPPTTAPQNLHTNPSPQRSRSR